MVFLLELADNFPNKSKLFTHTIKVTVSSDYDNNYRHFVLKNVEDTYKNRYTPRPKKLLLNLQILGPGVEPRFVLNTQVNLKRILD